MLDFIARRVQKITSSKISGKWGDLKTRVHENPKGVIDDIVAKISEFLSDDTAGLKKVNSKDIELAELLAGNLFNIAASEGGQILLGTIADIYTQHAARKKVSGLAAKINDFNERMERKDSHPMLAVVITSPTPSRRTIHRVIRT